MRPVTKSMIEHSKALVSLPFSRHVARFRSMSEEDFWTFQAKRIGQVYSDAVLHVPYYRDRTSIYPEQFRGSEDALEMLAQLPVLPKAAVRSNADQFARTPRRFLTVEHTTGGTTGSPMKVRASLLERGFTEAILRDRYQDVAGTPTPRILRLSGFLDKARSDGIFLRVPGTRYAYLSIYDLKSEFAPEIAIILQEFQPEVMHGYASALHQLSSLFHGAPPSRGKRIPVISTSETLYEHQREDIEANLHARVHNEYGSQEGQHLVLECHYRSLHIHPARGIVEILKFDSDEPARSGDLGRVVVSGLANRSMPLLRYDLGDSAVSTGYSTGCACGSQWPTIGSVVGRTDDLVRTRDGRMIGLLSHSTLKDLAGIKEAQIIQNDYERFTYLISPIDANALDRRSIENHILRELQTRLGSGAYVTFEYVNAIPRTDAGKFRAVVVDQSLKLNPSESPAPAG